MAKTGVKRFFIIDAMALAYRSFFAIGRANLTTHEGMPTGAIYGTAMFMNKLLNEEKPDYLAVVTDTIEPTFRQDIYKDYKAHRDKIPDELALQLPHFYELLRCYGAPLIGIDGFEADDVIGTLCTKFATKKSAVSAFIVSGDKDFMQLINENIFMFSPKKSQEAVIIDVAGVREKFHCRPDQVVNCLALIGDTSDNVPGVSGIGDKGAAKLIELYGSLEGIYKNIDKISGAKQREALIKEKDNAFMSRELVTIKTDIDIKFKLDDFSCDPKGAATNKDLLAFFERFEFRQLADKIREFSPATTEDKAKAAKPVLSRKEATIDEAKAWDRVVISLSEDGSELSLLHPTEQTSISFKKADLKSKRDDLNEILSSSRIIKIGHDLKTMTHKLHDLALPLNLPLIDTKICDYLIDPNYEKLDLVTSAKRYLKRDLSPFDDLYELSRVDSELYSVFENEINARELTRVFYEIEMPLLPVLAKMEETGVFVDTKFLKDYSSELGTLGDDLCGKIYKMAGREFNINSTKQLQQLLFEELKLHETLGLKNIKRTKTGFSTDESVLVKMSGHPLAKLIIDYREVTKLKTTFVDGLREQVDAKTGRLHTHFEQTGTATGRLSSEDPNLQNIPMRSELGQRIRRAFRPKENNWSIVSADYSQVEIRLLAALANEDNLIEAFRKDEDIHKITAAKIFGVPENKVTPILRSRAKAVNFGIIYGMGPQRLSQTTGVTMAEAKDFIARYFIAYPKIKHYTEGLITSARELGYTKTLCGRRRPIQTINDDNRAVRVRSENIAVNAPIQGSAADIIKLAMIKIDQVFSQKRLQARMLLQIHDELLFEAPDSETEVVIDIVRDCMENAVKDEISVPLKVDIGKGKDWLSAH